MMSHSRDGCLPGLCSDSSVSRAASSAQKHVRPVSTVSALGCFQLCAWEDGADCALPPADLQQMAAVWRLPGDGPGLRGSQGVSVHPPEPPFQYRGNTAHAFENSLRIEFKCVGIFKALDNTLHTLSLFKATILIGLFFCVTPYRSSEFCVTQHRWCDTPESAELLFDLPPSNLPPGGNLPKLQAQCFCFRCLFQDRLSLWTPGWLRTELIVSAS